MNCDNCECSHDGRYGSGRFCSTKCARGYSTKIRRSEINEKVALSIRRTRGTDFRTCSVCNSRLTWSHFADLAKKLGTNETKFCSENCKLAAKDKQNRSSAFRQKMSDAAIRRLEKGEVWFGKQNFIEVFGKSIRCDSLLERSFVLWISRDEKVKDVRRSNVWIPYNEAGITRRYNPDFIVEFKDGSLAIAEVKSERVGKNDVWEDYRVKALTKRILLENYANIHNMKCMWFTQLTSPQTYKEVCTIHSS